MKPSSSPQPGRVTASQEERRQLPDFLVIGAARSGTTTLYEYFERHPSLFMSKRKEPAFFMLEEEYAKGFDYYASLFEGASSAQLCGEASTHYTVAPSVDLTARRIQAANPGVKLIYILRPPVDRLYSHYVREIKQHLWINSAASDIDQIPIGDDGCYAWPPDHIRPWRIGSTIERSLDVDPDFLIGTSKYIDHIRTYLEYFPRESLLVLLLEDLAARPRETLDQVYDFLGVQRVAFDEPIVANSTEEGTLPNYKRLRAKTRFAQSLGLSPSTARRFARFMPGLLKRMVGNTASMVQSADPQPLLTSLPVKIRANQALRAELLPKFERSNQELGEFLGRDLSHWNQ